MSQKTIVLLIAAATALFQGCAVGNRIKGSTSFQADNKDAIFYSDLGPNSIDVSLYSDKQKENYAVYAHTCSQCHSLARSINAPMVSRGFWDFYILGMRARSHFMPGTEITKAQAKAIVDFLEFDASIRKVGRKEEFDGVTTDLKKRFDPILEERVRRLQEGRQPKLLPEQR